MYAESDNLMISALQHYLYCPRQCALIHIEQIWAENIYTAEGRVMHERVHSEDRASRGKLRISYGIALRSLRLGVSGQADVVEFHRQEDGSWRPFPVEYKRGRPKNGKWDEVQLCAQAICLEEMLEVEIPAGALFYGKTRRRKDVIFDANLRSATENTASRLHELIGSGQTPKPVFGPKCESCSLCELCMPKVTGAAKSVAKYLSRMLED
ncbi:MAG: CRISPR-associated protein Cas4 [Desulfobacterales bacterium]|jgi:CRISPR-associated exonuclease Cas4|nr:CRISPR-associated protein Cas4 [Desulfobacterales bacterium]